ncbi:MULTISPECIES: sodium ion-translocating decarboxylase subunit beta [unclassified Fusibacter]|uniref:sodium ion-translocating decarboxylase subunit beta n=1 Tax=unclassified Fusibacter TaxID=2624464 RepID=UPI0010138EE0|nr:MULTISPECIES: sodium ion-translocating decarboxylase subunit beta [unclassified Fusibacter]MCK8059586.1 sodium ion-translocating decarboxylase subunit beta [Fusibacter sp. A2]NPE21387.1 hypothetical protein [Fusibacter sp. A1]RXV61803.1 hypothetical protein DWB64_06080 [Fusibacter sp. A1]
MIKRVLAVIGIVITLSAFAWLVVQVATPDAGAVGIIGGADGPTAFFVASRVNWVEIGFLVGAGALIIHLIVKNNRQKKNNKEEN